MNEYLSPGVYVEEVPMLAQVSPGVSPSTMGIIGYAPQGPANVATLVTSYEQYSRVFGGLIPESQMPMSVAAFFANGGQRAYIVRIPPADAVAANAKIQAETTAELLEETDGATSSFSGEISTATGAAPLVPGSVSLSWRTDGAAVSTFQNTLKLGSTTTLSTVVGQKNYTGRINPTVPVALAPVDPNMYRFKPGTVILKLGSVTITIPAAGAVSTGSASGVTAVFDHRTGIFSIEYTTAPVSVMPVQATYIPTVATTASAKDATGYIETLAGSSLADGELVVITHGTVSKTFEFTSSTSTVGTAIPYVGKTATQIQALLVNAINAQSAELKLRAVAFKTNVVKLLPSTGETLPLLVTTTSSCNVAPATATTEGLWIGDVSTDGKLNYATGLYEVTTANPPTDLNGLYTNYTRNAWSLNPISVGAWANNIRVQVTGSPNFYDSDTGTYSRFDFVVALRNAAGNYVVVEQFEELVFDDVNSASYFADVVNELSDYITVTEPAGDVAPAQLSGVGVVEVIAGGEALPAGAASSYRQTIVATLCRKPIQPYSVTITYTDTDNTVRTITDDGAGSLVGAVSESGDNLINYADGIVNFKAGYLISGASLVTVTFAVAPAESAHLEDFGDSTKNYTVGTEGTFDSANWGRDQFTNQATLQADSKGLYAFEKVDDILQVVVPDFAGNLTATKDLLDYADLRAQQPQGGDRYIILTTPSGYTAEQAKNWFRFSLRRASNYAALYWPWVRVADPLQNNRPKVMPPLGHIAGVYARTDSNKNVGKSPGGTVDGALTYLVGLETTTTLADRDLVYANKINPLINTAQTGLAVWGVRSISDQAEWKYINARRLFMYVEKNVFLSTWWAVFENNGPALWSTLTTQVSGFLGNLYAQGYFAGTSPSQAFFVLCDNTNNTSQTLEAGQVVMDIGIAPNKPAEFIRLRFQQKSLST